MKYLVFSDLHGSLKGLEYLQAAINAERPDVVLCLGDTLYGAFDSSAAAVAKYLSNCPVTILGVRGNCDYYNDEKAIGFALPEEQFLFFKGHRLILRHVPYFRDVRPGDIAMYGHTHVKSLYEENGVIYLNPGSIGKARDEGESYAIIEPGRIVLKRAEDRTEISSLAI